MECKPRVAGVVFVVGFVAAVGAVVFVVPPALTTSKGGQPQPRLYNLTGTLNTNYLRISLR